jgi:hypothetical protein
VAKVAAQRPTKLRKTSFIDGIEPISCPDTGIKLNLYGRSGTGKTTVACTAPKPLCLIKAAEDGTRSVHTEKGVYVTPMMSHPDQLSELCEHQRETSKYKTIVLDHAGTFQELVLKAVTGRDDLPVQIGFGEVTRDQWGQCAMIMKDKLREVMDLADKTGCNVIIIAQEKEFNAEESSDLLIPCVMSALSPSVANWLNPAVDYICQTFIRQTRVKVPIEGKGGKKLFKIEDKIQFCLRTGPHPVFMTKFRLPKGTKLPELIVDPNFSKIQRLIEGQGG